MTAPFKPTKPRSTRKQTVLGAGVGAYLGGSKAFGTRATAGETLDWSKHFATKFPKAAPALGKVDRVANAAHNLPRGPLLSTGVVGGALAGAAYAHHRAVKNNTVAKALQQRPSATRVTWTEGRHHRDVAGRFAAVGSAASMGVAGIYGSKTRKHLKTAKKHDKKVSEATTDVADHLNYWSSKGREAPYSHLHETFGHDYADLRTHEAFQQGRAAMTARGRAMHAGKIAGTATLIGAALGGTAEALHHSHDEHVGKVATTTPRQRRPRVTEKVSRTKQALSHMSITPEQARHATVLGQVGSSAGTVAGSAAGAVLGIRGKHVAQGMGIGAGVGAAFGGGVGASLGLYSGKHHRDGVVDKQAPATSDKWERRTANGLNVVGGAADVMALKTGYQATKRAFKVGKPAMDKAALPLAVTGIAAAGVNAHLINKPKKKETTVAKSDNVEEIFKFSREAKKGAKIGAAIEGGVAGLRTKSIGGAAIGAGVGAVEGAAVGGLVHGHRRRVAGNAALTAQNVAKSYDVEEIFKLSREAKKGATIGGAVNGLSGLAVHGNPKLAAVNTAVGAAAGAGIGGLVHRSRQKKAIAQGGAQA